MYHLCMCIVCCFLFHNDYQNLYGNITNIYTHYNITYVYVCITLLRLHYALMHLKCEEDKLNKILVEEEAQINRLTELIGVVEM